MSRAQVKEAADLVVENSKAAEAGKNGKKAAEEDVAETESDPVCENAKALSDKEIIFLLCDWAVTTKRCGLHRIFYVVFLLRKRQIDWIEQFKNAIRSVSRRDFCGGCRIDAKVVCEPGIKSFILYSISD